MVSLYGLLFQSTGLSVQEAASVHGVSDQTVTDWVCGSATPSEKAMQYLYRLLDLQNHAAQWLLGVLIEEPSPESIKICVTNDDDEAQTLGWPTPSAMNAAVRRLLENAGDGLRSRIQLVFNPEGEERAGIFFMSIRLRPDGTFEAPGETTRPPALD